MKPSWTVFFREVLVLFVASLGISYGISAILDWRRGADEVLVGSTLVSMGLGSLVASVMMSLVAGWKGWRLKPLMFATALVALLYAHVGSVFVTLSAAIAYYAGHSLCLALGYFFQSRAGPESKAGQ